jgi:hypothetical protein
MYFSSSRSTWDLIWRSPLTRTKMLSSAHLIWILNLETPFNLNLGLCIQLSKPEIPIWRFVLTRINSSVNLRFQSIFRSWGRYCILFFSWKLITLFCSHGFFDNIQSRFYLGEVGNGAAMKLIVNMIMGRFYQVPLSIVFCFASVLDYIVTPGVFNSLQYDGNLFWRVASQRESRTGPKCTGWGICEQRKSC